MRVLALGSMAGLLLACGSSDSLHHSDAAVADLAQTSSTPDGSADLTTQVPDAAPDFHIFEDGAVPSDAAPNGTDAAIDAAIDANGRDQASPLDLSGDLSVVFNVSSATLQGTGGSKQFPEGGSGDILVTGTGLDQVTSVSLPDGLSASIAGGRTDSALTVHFTVPCNRFGAEDLQIITNRTTVTITGAVVVTHITVASTGNASDANPGTPDGPFRTVTRGLAVSGDHCTVNIGVGTYDESSGESWPSGDTPAANVPAGVTISGSGMDDTGGPLTWVKCTTGGRTPFSFATGDQTSVTQLLASFCNNGFYLPAGSSVYFDHVRAAANATGVAINTGSLVATHIDNSKIDGNTDVGLSIVGPSSGVVPTTVDVYATTTAIDDNHTGCLVDAAYLDLSTSDVSSNGSGTDSLPNNRHGVILQDVAAFEAEDSTFELNGVAGLYITEGSSASVYGGTFSNNGTECAYLVAVGDQQLCSGVALPGKALTRFNPPEKILIQRTGSGHSTVLVGNVYAGIMARSHGPSVDVTGADIHHNAVGVRLAQFAQDIGADTSDALNHFQTTRIHDNTQYGMLVEAKPRTVDLDNGAVAKDDELYANGGATAANTFVVNATAANGPLIDFQFRQTWFGTAFNSETLPPAGDVTTSGTFWTISSGVTLHFH